MRISTRTVLFSGLLACLPVSTPPVYGAEVIEEVLVVGSRLRAESLADAPVAVAVVDGETLDDLNLTEMQDISQMV